MPTLARRATTPPELGTTERRAALGFAGALRGGPVTSADFEVLDATAWARVTDGPAPDGDVVVPLARFLAEKDALLARTGRLGVRLSSDASVSTLAADLGRIARIEVEFPKFTDGRGYSIARRLREEHGWAGELVAVGDVLRDQLLYMHRCGFSAFELAPGLSPESALRAFDETTVHYQAAADRPLPLWKRTARSPA